MRSSTDPSHRFRHRPAGRIVSLLITDNQQVAAGQLLAEIDPRDYLVRLAQSQAQYKQAVAQLAQQKANYGQARANVIMAQADATQADRDLRRYRAVDAQAITQQQRDNAVATAQSNRAKLMASQQAADAARAQIETAQASVQQSQSDVDNAKLQLSYTKITAPVAGRITRRTVEVGNVVAPGPPLLAVVPEDLWVTANYKETQLDLMRVGQHVRIRIDAYPDVDLSAHVDSFQRGTGSAFSSLPAEKRDRQLRQGRATRTGQDRLRRSAPARPVPAGTGLVGQPARYGALGGGWQQFCRQRRPAALGRRRP